jgi:phenylacetate-CoA ligase
MNLYRDVFFRGLDQLRGRHNVARLRFLQASQYWSAEQLRMWQLDRLNTLLVTAREHSPFFAERLADLRLPLTELRELEAVPALTRADIQRNQEKIRTQHLPAARYVPNRTGGSSGEPIHYYWDKRGQDWNRGSVYRAAEWAGTYLGDRALQMSGSRYDLSVNEQRGTQLANWLLRHRVCPVAAPTRDDFERYRGVLNDFRPASIWGYSSAIDVFAAHLEETAPGADYPFLRALITSSETLRPEQRERIERVFGAGKVFDHYGSREAYIASECAEHRGYHIHAEVLVVEVVDADGRACAPGELGRVLVTDLSNHAFPFVRYEIGDLAVAAPAGACACGVSLPRLERVEGRISDLVVLRDRVLTAPNFCTLFSTVKGIDAFQVRQDAVDKLRILIEPGTAYTPAVESFLRASLATMVGDQAHVEFVTGEPIAVPSSGKRRFVISDVGLGAQR